jgi:hypothetical protein
MPQRHHLLSVRTLRGMGALSIKFAPWRIAEEAVASRAVSTLISPAPRMGRMRTALLSVGFPTDSTKRQHTRGT